MCVCLYHLHDIDQLIALQGVPHGWKHTVVITHHLLRHNSFIHSETRYRAYPSRQYHAISTHLWNGGNDYWAP